MKNKVFSTLKVFGFNDTDDIEIYKKEEEKKQIKKKKPEPVVTGEVDINSLMYLKNIKCPVCSTEFSCRAVKCRAPRIKSRDSDMFVRYYIINPYLYDVWICDLCGYAALKSDFHKIRPKQIRNVQLKISNSWKKKYFPPIFDEKIAIERYKLALLNAVLGEFDNSTKAYICLKIAWMYRILEKHEEEQEFLKKALEGFLIAYDKEVMPVYGLDKYSMMYLIGELYRRTGDYENAKLWLGTVITSFAAPQRVKDKAREMREEAMLSERCQEASEGC